jgi:hypothetical protein
MSGINGLGYSHPQVERAAVSAPMASTATPASAGSADPLQAIQNLVKQLESSASTMAIPAHQNW